VIRRAYLYFILTFALGAVIGGAGTYYYGWYSGHWRHDFDLNRAVSRMTHDLSLEDAQAQKLRLILQESSRKRKELQQKNQPQIDALHEETRNQIRQILNADQLAKFNEHVRMVDERMKKLRSP